MFLGTTALSEFWDPRDEILFLGTWCLPYNTRDTFKNLPHSILPSPWDDSNRIQAADSYILACYESFLKRLHPFLNEIHHINCSQKYWRILIGPWLLYALEAVYDRYIHLKTALKSYPNLTTLTLKPTSFKTPKDTLGFINWIIDDPYNLQIYSQILQVLGYKFPEKKFSRDYYSKNLPVIPIGVTRDLKLLRSENHSADAKSTSNPFPKTSEDLGHSEFIGVYDTDFSEKLLMDLTVKSQQKIIACSIKPFSSAVFSTHKDFSDTRQSLSGFSAADEFEKVFNHFLSLNFPTLHLESYHQARQESLTQIQPRLTTLISSVAWRFDEPFKFIAAESSEQRKKLIAVQHGGGYGTFKTHTQEHHESTLGDEFFVWGWADQKPGSNLKNIPSPKLSALRDSGLKKKTPHSNPPTVLFLATAQPRYPLGFHSSPIGSQWEKYFEWQSRFFTSLKHSQPKLKFRSGVFEYGHFNRQRIQDKFPWIEMDEGTQSIIEVLKSIDLVTVDYQGATVFLESMVFGVPTIIFYEEALWEIREDVKNDYLQLEQAGILWKSPEYAAQHVKNILPDPWKWWNSRHVQKARIRFIDKQALTRKNWESDWISALLPESH